MGAKTETGHHVCARKPKGLGGAVVAVNSVDIFRPNLKP